MSVSTRPRAARGTPRQLRTRTAVVLLAALVVAGSGLAGTAAAADGANPPQAADCSAKEQQTCTLINTLDADGYGEGIAVGKDGRVYATAVEETTPYKSRLFEVNPDENRQLAELDDIVTVAMVDESSDTLYVGTDRYNGAGDVLQADLRSDGLTFHEVAHHDDEIKGLALDGANHLYAALWAVNDVYRDTLGTNPPKPEKVTHVPEPVTGVVVDPEANYLYVGTEAGKLFRQRMEPGYAPKQIAENLGDMRGLQADGEGNLIYATKGGDLFRLGLDAKNPEPVKVATGLGTVRSDIALDDQGNAYVVNEAKQVYKITGAGRPFTSGSPAVSPGGDVTLKRDGSTGYPGVRLTAQGDSTPPQNITVTLPQDKGLEFVGEPGHQLTVSADGGQKQVEGTLSQDGRSLTFDGVDLGLTGQGSSVTAWVAVRAGERAQPGDTALTFQVGSQSGTSSRIHITD